MSDNNVNNVNNEQTEQEYNEVVRVRREKLAALKEAGKDPFVLTKFDVSAYSETIRNNFEEYENKTVTIAGRIISRRIMGKASFVNIQDSEGNIQSYIRRDDVDAGLEEGQSYRFVVRSYIKLSNGKFVYSNLSSAKTLIID